MKTQIIQTKPSLFFSIALVIFLFFLFVVVAYALLPVNQNANPPYTWGWGVDWKEIIRPASLAILNGESPYAGNFGILPPWAYLIILPIAILPPGLGSAVIFVLNYFIYAFFLYQKKISAITTSLFLLNAFIFTNGINGNLDFLSILGFVLPPQIGVLFALIKPQIGIGIVIYWMFEEWMAGKWRALIRLFYPAVLIYCLSFAIFGFWPINLLKMPHDPYNASLWPWGIVIGLIFLIKAILKKKANYAMSASPFFAPYVNISSYSVVLLLVKDNTVLMIIAVILSWVIKQNLPALLMFRS